MGVALFAVQNSHEVRVRFLAWEINTSLALLLIGAVATGALLLGLFALFRQVGFGLKLWDERSRARKTAADLEQARLAGQELRNEIERLQEQNRRLSAQLAAAQSAVAQGAEQAAERPPLEDLPLETCARAKGEPG
jgi:uncharacterized protein HemY